MDINKDGSTSEAEYFHSLQQEQLAKLKEIVAMENAEEAATAAKELHFHKCGKCGADMKTEIFKGVEIERCPACGAVLLDPGELEELAGKDQSGFFSSLFGSK
ncbi:MAG: hypothetical protein CL930_06875 [Deltaproteobacteria bacterium]|nr:hypothetical protein [Deltaproteobacteria bacterium]|tara:strand:- start:119 stop:427 length:309 start_codon:yes stop_codon:yes gene_type:complete